MKRFGLKTAAIALLAGGMIVTSVGDAEAQYRRRHYNNDGAAVGAAIALGALAFGAAAMASQQRSYGGSEFVGYDEWGNPVYQQRRRYVAPRAYYEPAPGYVYEEPGYVYAPQPVYRRHYRAPRTVYGEMGHSKFNQ